MSAVINRAALGALVAGWLEAGKTVAAPVAVRGKLLYQAIRAADQAIFDARRRPANSIKEFFFPRHERLFRYRFQGKEIELADALDGGREQVILAARPCDAAALPILDRVFNWDFVDEFYAARRERTTVITLACAAFDDACFCTSVGGGPAHEAGSDAMLFEAGDGLFEVRTTTDKGRALFAGHLRDFDRTAPMPEEPPARFDTGQISAFLASNFKSPFWTEQTLACIGCGACAYTCPACHCFDIADEGNALGGSRVKNWDSCQFPLFTEHASGHNPRANQGQRQRQRIYHKFSIYPAKFGAILCTGCGNCTRNCPEGLGVLSVLEAVK